MKIFKTVDERFEELGFKKIEDNEYVVEYIREVKGAGNYTNCIALSHKQSGNHIIQSYQKDINSDGLNNTVGITPYVAKLCIKKMKQKGWA